jgi:alkylhydroperoxidase/carboxymuconolactone decarboxylase family protein YurZ
VDQRLEDLLRRLALNDEAAISSALDMELGGATRTRPRVLDAKTDALIRLAALIASEAATASYDWAVATAVSAGATEDELVEVLDTLAPIVGVARVDWAAPELAVALGVDIGAEDRRNRIEARLRRLAATTSDDDATDPPRRGLATNRPGAKDVGLLRLAALVALGATSEAYRHTAGQARTAGATDEEILGVLLAVAPTVGLARVVAATPGVALAMGYDIDAALEETGDLPR